MMPQVQNKAGQASKSRCEYCGRQVGAGVQQCRPAPSGWWCWQRGLIHDPALFAYRPDPIGEDEQAVIDEYAPRIADAQKVVDEAMVSLAAVEVEYNRAWSDALDVGITQVGATYRSPPSSNTRHASDREQRRLTHAVQQATAAKDKAQARLSRARIKLQEFEARCEYLRRAARQPSPVEE